MPPISGSRLDAVFLFETVYAAAGIQEFLFACEERVASGADLHAQVRFNGTRLERVAASASSRSHVVFRMNSLFHRLSPLSALSFKRAQSYAYLNSISRTSAVGNRIAAGRRQDLHPISRRRTSINLDQYGFQRCLASRDGGTCVYEPMTTPGSSSRKISSICFMP